MDNTAELDAALDKKLRKLRAATSEVKAVLQETEKKLHLNEKFLSNRIRGEFKSIIDAEKDAKTREINANTSLSAKERKLQIQMNDVIISVAEDEADSRQAEVLSALSAQVGKEVAKVRGLSSILVAENERLVDDVSTRLPRLTPAEKKAELAGLRGAVLNLRIVKQSLLFSMFTLVGSGERRRQRRKEEDDDVIVHIRSIHFGTLVKPVTCWIFLPVPTEFCADRITFAAVDLSWKSLVNLADFTKPFCYRLEVMLSGPLPPLVEAQNNNNEYNSENNSLAPSTSTSPAPVDALMPSSPQSQGEMSAGRSSRKSLDLSEGPNFVPPAAARRMSTGASKPRGFGALFGHRTGGSQSPKRSASTASVKENERANREESNGEQRDGEGEREGEGESVCECCANARKYLQAKQGTFTQVYEGPENMFSVARLFPGSSYSFRVCAGYSNTFGGWSKTLNLETRPVPCPTGLASEKVALTSMTLVWTYPYYEGSSIRFVVAHRVCEDAPPPPPPPSEDEDSSTNENKESVSAEAVKEDQKDSSDENEKRNSYESFYDDSEEKAMEKERLEKEMEESLRIYGEDIDADKEGYKLIDTSYSEAFTEVPLSKTKKSQQQQQHDDEGSSSSAIATATAAAATKEPTKFTRKFKDIEGFKVHEFRVRAILLIHGWDTDSNNASNSHFVREYASHWSQPLRVRTNVVDATCEARVVYAGCTTATVRWTPIDVDGGSYQVEVSKKRMLKTVGAAVAYEGPATRHVLTGLEPDTKYEVRVRAGSDDRWGQWSHPVAFQTLRHAAPAKVTVRVSCISAYLSWTPACEGRATSHQIDVLKLSGDNNNNNSGGGDQEEEEAVMDNEEENNESDGGDTNKNRFVRRYDGIRTSADIEGCFEPGAVYALRVRGGCDGEWGEWSRPTRVRMDVIEAPEYFDASDVRCISVTINWSPVTIDPRVASVYQIQARHLGRVPSNADTAATEKTPENSSGSSEGEGEYKTVYDGKDTCCVWGVLPQHKYQFRVRAGYEGRWGPWRGPLSTVSTAITAPTEFKLDVVAALSLSCSWRFVIFDPRKTTDYQIELRDNSSNNNNSNSSSNSDGDFVRVYEGQGTEAVVPLRPETPYEMRLRAGCEQYWSDWLTTQLTAPAIPVPSGLRVARLTCISAALAWDPVVLDVRQQTRYAVEAEGATDGSGSASGSGFRAVYDGPATEFVMPLVPEMPYTVRLRAYCSSSSDDVPQQPSEADTKTAAAVIISSEWTVPVKFVAPEVPPPADECVVSVTCTSATLRWCFGDQTPSSLNNNNTSTAAPIKPITYLVGVSGGNAVTGVVRQSAEVVSQLAVTEHVVPLLPEGGYKLRIRPSCDGKWGKWGRLLKVITPKVPTPAGLAVRAAACASLRIAWDPIVLVGTHHVVYEAELRRENPTNNNISTTTSSTTIAKDNEIKEMGAYKRIHSGEDPQATAAGTLVPGTHYRLRVRAGFGSSSYWSEWAEITASTLPLPAVERFENSATCISARVAWAPAALDPVRQAVYQVRREGDAPGVVAYEGPDTHFAEVAGTLAPDTEHVYWVRAGFGRDDLWGPWSRTAVRTRGVPAPALETPNRRSTCLYLRWGHVDVDPAIETLYRLEMKARKREDFRLLYEGPKEGMDLVGVLVPDRGYLFRVRAGYRIRRSSSSNNGSGSCCSNGGGVSDTECWGEWAEEVVRTLPIPAPTYFISETVGCASATLKWAAVDIFPQLPTAYAIEVSGDGGATFAAVYEGQDTVYTTTALAPTSKYLFRVRAGARGYWGAWAELAVRTTAVPVPTGLRADLVTFNAIHLVWNKAVILPTAPTLYRIKIACCKFEKTVETQNLDVALRLDPSIPAYMFRIAAGSGDKLWSKWSDPSLDIFTPKWLAAGWRPCPAFVEVRRRYAVHGLTVEKTSESRSDSVVLGADQLIPGFEKHKWGVRLLPTSAASPSPSSSSSADTSTTSSSTSSSLSSSTSSSTSFPVEVYVGVAPLDIHQNADGAYKRAGWFLAVRDISLVSGPPHNYKGRAYGPTVIPKPGDTIGLEMNMKKGTLSFSLNGTELGTAYEDIPLNAPLVPVVVLTNKKDSVELVL